MPGPVQVIDPQEGVLRDRVVVTKRIFVEM